jgi:hypothetical protein
MTLLEPDRVRRGPSPSASCAAYPCCLLVRSVWICLARSATCSVRSLSCWVSSVFDWSSSRILSVSVLAACSRRVWLFSTRSECNLVAVGLACLCEQDQGRCVGGLECFRESPERVVSERASQLRAAMLEVSRGFRYTPSRDDRQAVFSTSDPVPSAPETVRKTEKSIRARRSVFARERGLRRRSLYLSTRAREQDRIETSS